MGSANSSGGNANNDGARPATGSPTLRVVLTVFAALTYVLF